MNLYDPDSPELKAVRETIRRLEAIKGTMVTVGTELGDSVTGEMFGRTSEEDAELAAAKKKQAELLKLREKAVEDYKRQQQQDAEVQRRLGKEQSEQQRQFRNETKSPRRPGRSRPLPGDEPRR